MNFLGTALLLACLTTGAAQASFCYQSPLSPQLPYEEFKGQPKQVVWTATSANSETPNKNILEWTRIDSVQNGKVSKSVLYTSSSKTTDILRYAGNVITSGTQSQVRLSVMDMISNESNDPVRVLDQLESQNKNSLSLSFAYDAKSRPLNYRGYVPPTLIAQQMGLKFDCQYPKQGTILETQMLTDGNLVLRKVLMSIALDQAGRVIKTTDQVIGEAAKASGKTVTLYTYSADGRSVLYKVSDASAAILLQGKISYDSQGRQISREGKGSIGMQTETWKYDSAGNWIDKIHMQNGFLRLRIQRTITY